MKKIIFAAIMCFAIQASVIFAFGGEPFAFLKLGMGTRATGMGGAFASIADDASAAYYNPAGTVNLSGLEFMAETYFLSFGRNLNYISTAKPFVISSVTYAAGFSWINYSSGSDIETRLTNSPEPDSRIADSSNVFTFNVAAKFSPNISLGGNFKFLFENLGTYRATGVGFDLGGMARIIDNLTVGFSYTGISTNITWSSSTRTESVPQAAIAGLSYKYADMFGLKGFCLLPSVDFVYNLFSGFKIKAGAELSVNDFLFLRGGYNSALTLGAGIRLKPSKIFSVKIDYAFVSGSMEPGASNHRIGAVIVYVFPESGVARNSTEDQKQQPLDGPGGQIIRNGSGDEYEW
jgi:hypothetical protein